MPESKDKDFVLPNEPTSNPVANGQTSNPTTGGQTSNPTINEQTSTSTIQPKEPAGVNIRQPMSGREILMGSFIVLIGAFMFFFVSRWFTENMIKKHKGPIAASRAGWSLFFFLTFTTAMVVFGFLGGLWTNLMFIILMGFFCIASWVFFVICAGSK